MEMRKYKKLTDFQWKLVNNYLIDGGALNGEKINRAFKNIWMSSKNRAGDPFKDIR